MQLTSDALQMRFADGAYGAVQIGINSLDTISRAYCNQT